MFFEQTFKIFFDNGNVEETDNLISWINKNYIGGVERFYYNMKWLCKYEKPSFYYYSYYHSMYENNTSGDFFLYTSNNIMISPDLFKGEYYSYRDSEWKIWYNNRYYSRKQWQHFHFKKGYTSTYNRKIETISERRAVAAVIKEEGEPEFRGRRRNLPNPWDDIHARRSLSWKDCTKRKRQYKGKH